MGLFAPAATSKYYSSPPIDPAPPRSTIAHLEPVEHRLPQPASRLSSVLRFLSHSANAEAERAATLSVSPDHPDDDPAVSEGASKPDTASRPSGGGSRASSTQPSRRLSRVPGLGRGPDAWAFLLTALTIITPSALFGVFIAPSIYTQHGLAPLVVMGVVALVALAALGYVGHVDPGFVPLPLPASAEPAHDAARIAPDTPLTRHSPETIQRAMTPDDRSSSAPAYLYQPHLPRPDSQPIPPTPATMSTAVVDTESGTARPRPTGAFSSPTPVSSEHPSAASLPSQPSARRVQLANGRWIEQRYCDTCRLWRPLRASHCRVCRRCIDIHDHHCVWVNNCIARNNYRAFLLLLAAVTLLAWLIFGFTVAYLVVEFARSMADLAGRGVGIAVCIITGFFGWAIGGFLGFHASLVARNMTTHEHVRQQITQHNRQVLQRIRAAQIERGESPTQVEQDEALDDSAWAFDEGCWRNCYAGLCRSKPALAASPSLAASAPPV